MFFRKKQFLVVFLWMKKLCFVWRKQKRGAEICETISEAVPSHPRSIYSHKCAAGMDGAELMHAFLNKEDRNTVAKPIPAQKSYLMQGIQPIRETGNAAHMSRAFWVVPAGVLLIMIWHSCRLLTRSIPNTEEWVQQQHPGITFI